MALVTLQRSPTPSAASSASTATTTAGEDFGSEDERRINQSLSESFFMVKGAALFLQQGSSPQGQKAHPPHKHAGDLPQHLQVMINILRSEDRIKLAVRLESARSDRVRYMVVVYTSGRQDTEENILLGMDFNNLDSKSCSVGMVLPLWSDTKIHLDGDGAGDVVSNPPQDSLQLSLHTTVSLLKDTAAVMQIEAELSYYAPYWYEDTPLLHTSRSALQVLHKACEVSRRFNYFPGGMALTWMGYYESCIASDQSCINEWNAMKDLETTRPDSPIMFVDKPSERERTECLIKAKLRSIMTCQDLENVTCKQIRTELEQNMNCNLKEFKEFIDNEMLLILGQMDKATLIFDHVYLGSEWNASNLEELQETGVSYILNVTREIDNFFPGTFSYHNVRVYDEDSTDLLAHWNETYNFIVKAKKNHSKCLVHCKMGVSRSASTVIAYAMKEYGWSLEKAYNFVKEKRNITRPNPGFMRQLAEYEGILDASKQRHNKLWQPDTDCEMADSQQGLAQHCGGEEGEHLTPEPGMFHCCEEELSEKGAVCPSQYRTVALEVDPAYNNYYFRRLSDSALDSEPSTPVRGPPLLSMEKVFIEIDDVERDALLDDEAFDGHEGLPLSHFGPTAEGTAAQTSGRGPEPLEELRLRLEFSTVEEEDEEDVQKEEAEMEVLMQPDEGGGGEGNGSETQYVETEGDAEGIGMDLATLNENSNNNNRLNVMHDCNENAPFILLPSETSMLSKLDQTKTCWKNESSTPTPKLCLNPSSSPKVPSAFFPHSHTSPEGVSSSVELLCPCGPLCNCANCAASLPAAPLNEDENPGEPLQSVELEEIGTFLDIKTDTSEICSAAAAEALPELMKMNMKEEKPAVARYLWKQQESLLLLHRSGLVRQRAERLERLSGLSQQSLQTLKPLQTCQRSQKSSLHDNVEEEFPSFAGGLANSSTPCQVRLEYPMVPLTNESLFGAVGSGLFTPTSSPHGSTLTRSSSSDSLRSVKGKPGLVRQRAQEIETRMRLAGLTVPSRLKRSNSLAKLASLDLSSEDLCSACSSDAGTVLLLTLSPEPDLHSPERSLLGDPKS